MPRSWRAAGTTVAGRLAAVIVFLGSVAMLRHVADLGGVAALVLLPVLWVSARGGRRELAGAVAAVAAFFVVPIVAVGAPRYPVTDWQVAALVTAMVAVAGVLVYHLVEQIRRQERQARQRQHDLEMLLELLREIARADDARAAVCQAARAVALAPACLLLEPARGGGVVVTAAAGAPVTRSSVPQSLEETVSRVLSRGTAEALSDPRPRLGDELFMALGAPSSVALEPVIGQGFEAVLLLTMQHTANERRREVLALLAAEAASAIARADLVAELESLARIDPLTGLPNRRAWEETLASAVATAGRDSGTLSVAVLDLDAFKQFNDAYGHQAGDRLLKQAGAAWRAALRDGDVLARWGGDEFAVLIRAPASTAQRAVERLRTSLPEAPFSAGVAEWQPGEDARGLLARADAELYAAKAAKRAAGTD